ncbi:class I SAM-dependent methyltransferase [Vibrio sinensis]|uniref:Class I SAM-dependent methyltransferase n=1 Tax=Vibrio sinensis TaxID=2302434 RepID=A0A3A6QCU6_9VIBR|nr:class I SAM-dependent methyltransferase [Vibrio sinensis]RJX65321.1 class I SAM-dependent methyltransferase [Vibrio sinensis]
MSEMYSKYAQQYDLAAQDNIYNAYLERPSLQALMGSVQGLKVLDLGCGSGIHAEYLISNGAADVTCVDVSPEMVAIVQQKLGDRVNSYTQDISIGLPKEESDSIDLIICPLVLHYIEELNPLFQEVARVLKPNGVMVFSTHHPFADFECSKSRNYFERELIHESWNTIGTPVNVTFYRRSLTEIMNAITMSSLVITQLSEGQVLEQAKLISLDTYLHLANNPNFIFVKCQKLA